ncbi:uncharacterized protein TNCV_119891 [Trichonephila clavipes]|nr:uncharacterized protein TNCV_119891 [Trichonephila clavipes]
MTWLPVKFESSSTFMLENKIKVLDWPGKLPDLNPIENTLQDALFICYKQSPDNAHSVALSQRSSSPCLIEDETFNDSDIINNLINYEDGQEAGFFETG